MGYFPFHDEYLEKTQRLTDEQMGRLTRAACRYNISGELCQDDDIGLAFDFIRADIDHAKEAYQHKCAVNAENGAKGGRPKKSERLEEKPKKANGFSETEKSQIKQNKTKQNKKNIDKENASPFEIALDEFRQYRKENHKPLTELAERKLLNELDRLSGGNEETKIQILDQSIRNGWAEVFELRRDRRASGGYEQHKVTDAELSHLLVNLDD